MDNKITIYRKYRPRNFKNIAGHKNIIEILTKQLENNKIAQSFLFAGQRGTGKTSIARILAKSVNCENLENGICCDKCNNCKTSDNQQNPDIIEMDAASNNGVDEIREIKNSVSTLPINSKYKVYIIDEVHMLTKSAFNALLKTLEEPPKHVIFILATTEYAKIPPTIISRCQIFNFKKIDRNSIKQRIKYIVENEGFTADDEVFSEISILCDGSLRDASNMIEQLINFSSNHISVSDLKSIFYIAPKAEKIKLLFSVFKNQAKEIIEYFENAENQGMDFDVFTLSLLEIIKELIEYKFLKSCKNFSVLDEIDVSYFSNIDTNILFVIADNLSEAYSKTKGTNISFNYLLISVLKSLNKDFNFSKEKLEPKPTIIEEETNLTMNEDQTKSLEDLKKIEFEQEQEDIEIYENEITLEDKSDSFPTFEQTIIIEELQKKPLSENPSLLKFEIQEEILEIESKKTFSVNVSEVINLLLDANKKSRELNENKISEIFKVGEDGKFVNSEKANDFKPLFGFQVIASSEKEILLRHSNPKQVKFLCFYLLDEAFQNKIKDFFSSSLIIPISEILWEDVKIEYKNLKTKNQLPNHFFNDFDEYYDKKKKEITNKSLNEKTIDAISHFFDIEDIDIEE